MIRESDENHEILDEITISSGGWQEDRGGPASDSDAYISADSLRCRQLGPTGCINKLCIACVCRKVSAFVAQFFLEHALM